MVEEEKAQGFVFNGINYEDMLRIDMLVEKKVVVELKSVLRMDKVFAKQCLRHLRLSNLRLGYVINFGLPSLKDGIVRLVN